MDKSKLLDALKNLKEAFLSTEKFTDMKLSDGTTIIRYDAEELAIGVPVMVLSDTGAIAIPDGDYVTDEGDKFTTVGGVVTAYVEAPEPVEPTAPVEPAPAQTMTEAQAKSIIESVIKESHFATEDFVSTKVTEILDSKNKEVSESFATQKTKTGKELTELKTKYETILSKFNQAIELIEKIAELPSEAPAEKQKEKVKFDLYTHKRAFKEDLNKIQETI